jgi:hypothetical protein
MGKIYIFVEPPQGTGRETAKADCAASGCALDESASELIGMGFPGGKTVSAYRAIGESGQYDAAKAALGTKGYGVYSFMTFYAQVPQGSDEKAVHAACKQHGGYVNDGKEPVYVGGKQLICIVVEREKYGAVTDAFEAQGLLVWLDLGPFGLLRADKDKK